MRPQGFSGSVVIIILLLILALAFLAGDTPIPVAVESAFAGSADGDENNPPMANASILEDPDGLWTNMSIHFSSNGSHDIDANDSVRFSWYFDDGSHTSTLANPVHAYQEPGTYNLTLTVTDQSNMVAQDTLSLTVKRNYGSSDIVIKAVDPNMREIFYDPTPGGPLQDAVMRDGWVAYICRLRADQEITVKITITGGRPADIYLFEEVHFQTYKRNPQVTFVPFRAAGFKHGAIGVFEYTFTASQPDRYYIVIDNKDWPIGTETEGPVNYNISIGLENPTPRVTIEILEEPNDLWSNVPIHFSSKGSYDVVDEGGIRFNWDFDNGTDSSILANPVYIYLKPGVYNVTLMVFYHETVIAEGNITLTVKFNWGDTDIIIMVVELDDGKTFKDPSEGNPFNVAVKRDGWVAYICRLRADQEIDVVITIIGDLPVDVYLFKEVDFQTYKRNPEVTFVPSEVEGSEQGVTGDFKYTFRAGKTDMYYIVIDNKDWPIGTETEGPVDYTIIIDPSWDFSPGWPENEDPIPPWIEISILAVIVTLAAVYVWAVFYKHSEI